MPRSIKKGPFVDPKLVKKIQSINEKGKKKIIKVNPKLLEDSDAAKVAKVAKVN